MSKNATRTKEAAEVKRSQEISLTSKKPSDQNLIGRIKGCWQRGYTTHPGIMRAIIALLVCILLWILLWFILFSGMSESADFLYAKF